jgi:ABC-2 type transport system ATP-binding protein
MVIHDLSLSLGTGFYLLKGRNGVGKSTLLKIMSGAIPADAGTIFIGDKNLRTESIAAKQLLAFVPDEPHIYSFITGQQFLDFIIAVRQPADTKKLNHLINLFGLQPHLGVSFDQMSFGTQKKFMLCSSFIGDNKVIIMDEPTVGIDHESREVLINCIETWVMQKEVMVLCSSHDENFWSRLPGRELLLSESLIAYSETPITNE